MKVDGETRKVGDVVSFPGTVELLQAAEKALVSHERKRENLSYNVRRAAKAAVARMTDIVELAEQDVRVATGKLESAKCELARVQALAGVVEAAP